MNDKKIAAARLAQADSKAQELVKETQSILAKGSFDLEELKQSLMALLEYLSSDDGRTDTNCHAVNSFFMLDDVWAERNLPDPFHDIFATWQEPSTTQFRGQRLHRTLTPHQNNCSRERNNCAPKQASPGSRTETAHGDAHVNDLFYKSMRARVIFRL